MNLSNHNNVYNSYRPIIMMQVLVVDSRDRISALSHCFHSSHLVDDMSRLCNASEQSYYFLMPLIT